MLLRRKKLKSHDASRVLIKIPDVVEKKKIKIP
jgi:hypothetical protein